jgi:hypothetical protein
MLLLEDEVEHNVHERQQKGHREVPYLQIEFVLVMQDGMTWSGY